MSRLDDLGYKIEPFEVNKPHNLLIRYNKALDSNIDLKIILNKETGKVETQYLLHKKVIQTKEDLFELQKAFHHLTGDVKLIRDEEKEKMPNPNERK